MASATRIITVEGPAHLATLAEARLRRLEQRWSRFVPTSEVNSLNAAVDSWVTVSPDTIRLVQTMQRAWVESGHRFDPTLVNELIALGYTASHDDGAVASIRVELADPSCTVLDVAIDADRSAIWMPAGLGLDPGGIGKGLAADLVVGELCAGGAAGALVSIGGDLAAAGLGPEPEGWRDRDRRPVRRRPGPRVPARRRWRRDLEYPDPSFRRRDETITCSTRPLAPAPPPISPLPPSWPTPVGGPRSRRRRRSFSDPRPPAAASAHGASTPC